jgi:glycerate 2-kinase
MTKLYIQNQTQLINHGNQSLREAAIKILDYALTLSDPYKAVHRSLELSGDKLSIGSLTIDLQEYERIFILGAGKATRGIALALEELLGDRICDGVIVLKHGDVVSLKHSRVIYAAHPIPDENSYQGAKEMMALAGALNEKDLVFAGITGGSSSLLALPAGDISLADIQIVNKLLLLSGADIVQINSVRKHLSRIKGGLLAQAILPATLINLTVSDVVGDMLDYITDPTVPDTSSFTDACNVLDEYGLWDVFPASAVEYLRRGGSGQETPKDFEGLPLYSFVIVAGDTACVAALEKASRLGFDAMILTSMLGGEAKEAGTFFASVGREITTYKRPLVPPCAIIAGGENVVTIGSEDRGSGGPNQEFGLSASVEIAGYDNIVIAAMDTDGFDGSTESAGAVVDGSTMGTAKAMGFNPKDALRKHDVLHLLQEIGDSIITGPTGTNVNDLKLLLVKEEA